MTLRVPILCILVIHLCGAPIIKVHNASDFKITMLSVFSARIYCHRDKSRISQQTVGSFLLNEPP